MQAKNNITYNDYCFFTDCLKELETLQDNRLYILKQKINRYIYNNSKLSDFFYTRINKYKNLIKNKDFLQKCFKYRDYFYKCLPLSYEKEQKSNYMPIYYFFYRKELMKLLYKNSSSFSHPITRLTIGKYNRLLKEDKEIQTKVFKIQKDANGIYNFVSAIINNFLHDKNLNEKVQTVFKKE